MWETVPNLTYVGIQWGGLPAPFPLRTWLHSDFPHAIFEVPNPPNDGNIQGFEELFDQLSRSKKNAVIRHMQQYCQDIIFSILPQLQRCSIFWGGDEGVFHPQIYIYHYLRDVTGKINTQFLQGAGEYGCGCVTSQ